MLLLIFDNFLIRKSPLFIEFVKLFENFSKISINLNNIQLKLAIFTLIEFNAIVISLPKLSKFD